MLHPGYYHVRVPVYTDRVPEPFALSEDGKYWLSSDTRTHGAGWRYSNQTILRWIRSWAAAQVSHSPFELMVPVEKTNWLDWFARQLRFKFRDYDPEREMPPDGPFTVPGLARQPYPYQLDAVRFFTRKRRGILADEQGLGKTVSAIATVQWLRCYPTVVVCPASTVETWKRTWTDWTGGTVSVGDFVPVWWDHRPHPDVMVLSWDAFREEGGEIGFAGSLILDEAHFAKNEDAQRTQAVHYASMFPILVMALTGTPIVNHPQELVTLLEAIRCIPSGMYRPTKRHAEELSRTFVLRRTKADTLVLPGKRREIVRFPVPHPERIDRAVEELYGWWRRRHPEIARLPLPEALDRIGEFDRASGLLRITRVFDALSEQKLPFVLDWIEWFLEVHPERKLVVFGRRLDSLRAIASEFGGLLLDGETPARERDRLVRRFQSDPDARLFVLSTRAGGVGLTLTAAHDAAMIDLPWTAADLAQAEDRLHRIGQERDVTIYLLLADHPFENAMLERIERKAELGRDMLDASVPVLP
jgi:SWI/SNF-related matrix-associated actin-dependent regulator 1 of chromatin subfamily A